MSKVIARLLTFFIGLPLVLAIVFASQMNFLALKIFVFGAGVLTANELCNMFANKFDIQKKWFILTLSALLPLSVIICGLLNIDEGTTELIYNTIFVLSILVSIASEVVVNETFEKSNSRILTTTFIIFYSTYLFTFLAKMTFLNVTGVENNIVSCSLLESLKINAASLFIVYFFLVIYLCDSLAWLFGVLFGKNNKGFIKASPNKSIVGFCGGLAGSMGISAIMLFLFPQMFGFESVSAITAFDITKIVLFGFIMGITAIFGDLVESVLKRSCEVKDSGDLIPGRGGVLDSVDSVIFGAPVFFLLIKNLYF